jgi:pimeloyl-ACP methyl ester carboxylesterase
VSTTTATEEQFADVGRGITLCYETIGEPADPPLLLIMGLGMQLIGWPEDFCEQLAGRGFRVIRFDNRDVGRSTHMKGRPPTPVEMVRRRIPGQEYTLTDMAQDTAGLLRELDAAPAHVVGASMGGMIAQTLAANHPETVRSLTSIMSTTGNRWKGQPAPMAYRFLFARPPTDREGAIARTERIFEAIGSPGLPKDLDRVRDVAARSWDRDHDRASAGRQLGAVLASGDRTADLKRITAPTLVIHGSHDKLVRPSGGKATAKAIPGAKLQIVQGMGHDIPRAAWPQIIDGIVANAGRAAA